MRIRGRTSLILAAAVLAAVVVVAILWPIGGESGGESAQTLKARTPGYWPLTTDLVTQAELDTVLEGLAAHANLGIKGSSSTETLASFVQPPVGAEVTASVVDTSWMATNQIVFMSHCGYYRVGQLTALTVTLTNLGYPGNAYPGSDCSGRIVVGGIAGPLLAMRWTWQAGALDPATMPGGIGTNNDEIARATHLYIRGGSNGGGPNPVELWDGLFASTNTVKGYIELSVPNTPKWVVYKVLGYRTLDNPQVQDFTVEQLDKQSVFEQGDEVYIQYGIAGDKGESG